MIRGVIVFGGRVVEVDIDVHIHVPSWPATFLSVIDERVCIWELGQVSTVWLLVATALYWNMVSVVRGRVGADLPQGLLVVSHSLVP